MFGHQVEVVVGGSNAMDAHGVVVKSTQGRQMADRAGCHRLGDLLSFFPGFSDMDEQRRLA